MKQCSLLFTLLAALLLAATAGAQTPSTPAAPTAPATPAATPAPAAPPPLDLDRRGQVGASIGVPLQRPMVDAAETHDVDEVAQEWLRMIDAGKYAESWSAAAPLLQERVSQSDWAKGVAAKRGPYGPTKRRVLQSAEPANAIANAPIARYMTVRYATEMEHGPTPTVMELVTCVQDRDGHWLVTGYGLP